MSDQWIQDHYNNENVFNVHLGELIRFRDSFIRNPPRRLCLRYEVDEELQKYFLKPSGLEYVCNEDQYPKYTHNLVGTGINCPYPLARKKEMTEIVEDVLTFALARNIPLIQGTFSFLECYDGQKDEPQLCFSADPHGINLNDGGILMKQSFEQWVKAVSELTPQTTQIVSSFRALNKAEWYTDGAGLRTIQGYFSLKTEPISGTKGFRTSFCGYALPIAKQLLVDSTLTFPLSSSQLEQLQTTLLAQLEPFRQQGFQISPAK